MRINKLAAISAAFFLTATVAAAQNVATVREQFISKLRTQPKEPPLECKGEKIITSASNAYTEIIFRDGCRILFDVPAEANCCVGLVADVWRFPDGIGSTYSIGYLRQTSPDGQSGPDGAAARDWNRSEPGGGATDGGAGGNGGAGLPGKTLSHPGQVVIQISKGIFNQSHELSPEDIAKIPVTINVSGAAGATGGRGGNGGKGGNGERGANGSGRSRPPCAGGGGPRGGDPGDRCPGESEFYCTRDGKAGGRGGAGGVGGMGGPGSAGADGSLLNIYGPKEVINGIAGTRKSKSTSWQLIVAGGRGGMPGASGSSGSGGLGGFSGPVCGGGPGANGASPATPSTPAAPAADGKPGKVTLHPT